MTHPVASTLSVAGLFTLQNVSQNSALVSSINRIALHSLRGVVGSVRLLPLGAFSVCLAIGVVFTYCLLETMKNARFVELNYVPINPSRVTPWCGSPRMIYSYPEVRRDVVVERPTFSYPQPPYIQQRLDRVGERGPRPIFVNPRNFMSGQSPRLDRVGERVS